jgi:hypothetical protein
MRLGHNQPKINKNGSDHRFLVIGTIFCWIISIRLYTKCGGTPYCANAQKDAKKYTHSLSFDNLELQKKR